MTVGSGLPRPIGYYLDEDMADASLESALIARNRVFHRHPTSGLPFVTHAHAYHLENATFVAYLERVARSVGTEIIDDTVVSVEQNDHGVHRPQPRLRPARLRRPLRRRLRLRR